MNTKSNVLSLAIAALLTTAPTFSAAQNQASSADSDLAAHLTLMREEEKIARDVYRVLYEQTGIRAFANITQSEQRHMDAMAKQLARFNLNDPITDDSTGAFATPKFKAMYEALIKKGQSSEMEALYVGAYIEELDIKDLINAIDDAQDAQLKGVYENLLRGSRNHLRAFVRQIERRGGNYSAQLMDQADVDVILASAQERGNGKQGGRGYGQGYGQGNH